VQQEVEVERQYSGRHGFQASHEQELVRAPTGQEQEQVEVIDAQNAY